MYVVCIFASLGCFGGGKCEPRFVEEGDRTGDIGGVMGNDGVVGNGEGAGEAVGTIGAGTTSGQSRHMRAIATAPPDELILRGQD